VQEVEFLAQKGLALDPDVVVVAYCLNDDFDVSTELLGFRTHQQFEIEGLIGRSLVLKSHLARLIWLRHAKPAPAAPDPGSGSRTERGFARLAELARRHGFQPVVMVFPLFEPAASYRWRAQHARVADLAARAGMPVLDLFEAFAAASGGDLRRLQGRCSREHPDEQGHRVAARELLAFLAAREPTEPVGSGSSGRTGHRE